MTTRPGRPSQTARSASASRTKAIVLVGFMGAGKSSVGAALGRKLGWPFEDLDHRIEAREQQSIEQIFRESGETVFRRLEHAALHGLVQELGASQPRVVALGGGAFSQPGNAALLDQAGISTVFLDAPVEELFRRCQKQQLDRPLRGDMNEFRRLYDSRKACYLKAGLRIETAGKDVETVAAETLTSLGL